MRGKQKLLWKRLTTGLLMVCLLGMLTGCGAGSDKMAMDMEYAETESAPQAMANGSINFNGYAADYKAEEPMEEAIAEEAGETEVSSPRVVSERKLIKTVDMNVETQNYDELLPAIQDQVTQLGGYIEHMNTYNGSAYYDRNPIRNADMTIRIPKDKLDDFVGTVSNLSNVVRRSDNVEDVTLAYVDLQSHRDALRTEQTRLLELLEKAESVEDIITIEQRLSDVRYQLESMESQLRTYDNQVDYSTVYLSIQEVEILTPVAKETVWERISGGFVESLDNIGEGFVEFGIWFVVNLPYLVVGAVMIGAFILLLIWLLKRVTKPAAPKKISKSQSTTQEDAPERKFQEQEHTHE